MDNDSTRNGGPLSLAERAKQGLLAVEPELPLFEIVHLEHLGDLEARRKLVYALGGALAFGDLEARKNEPDEHPYRYGVACEAYWITREAYRAWRNACPAELLSPLTQIHKWLGATPPAESILPVETSLPELPKRGIALVEAQQDKADCQAIARALWAEQPSATQADILKNSRIKPYLKKWPGKNTLPGWLSEVDPRPKERRQGRPRKTPV